MKVDGGLLQIAVAEQDLDRPQVRAGFDQVRRETMTQRVWVNVFAHAGALGDGRTTRPCW